MRLAIGRAASTGWAGRGDVGARRAATPPPAGRPRTAAQPRARRARAGRRLGRVPSPSRPRSGRVRRLRPARHAAAERAIRLRARLRRSGHRRRVRAARGRQQRGPPASSSLRRRRRHVVDRSSRSPIPTAIIAGSPSVTRTGSSPTAERRRRSRSASPDDLDPGDPAGVAARAGVGDPGVALDEERQRRLGHRRRHAGEARAAGRRARSCSARRRYARPRRRRPRRRRPSPSGPRGAPGSARASVAPSALRSASAWSTTAISSR